MFKAVIQTAKLVLFLFKVGIRNHETIDILGQIIPGGSSQFLHCMPGFYQLYAGITFLVLTTKSVSRRY